MRIDVLTDEPQQLVDAINKAIKDADLKTWEKVMNSKKEALYSHSPAQWKERAMLKPQILKDRVRLTIKWWDTDDEPDHATKGYILGRFTEILLVHFSNYFTHLETHP